MSMKDGIFPTFAQPDSSGYVQLALPGPVGNRAALPVGFHGEAVGPLRRHVPRHLPPATPLASLRGAPTPQRGRSAAWSDAGSGAQPLMTTKAGLVIRSCAFRMR